MAGGATTTMKFPPAVEDALKRGRAVLEDVAAARQAVVAWREAHAELPILLRFYGYRLQDIEGNLQRSRRGFISSIEHRSSPKLQAAVRAKIEELRALSGEGQALVEALRPHAQAAGSAFRRLESVIHEHATEIGRASIEAALDRLYGRLGAAVVVGFLTGNYAPTFAVDSEELSAEIGDGSRDPELSALREVSFNLKFAESAERGIPDFPSVEVGPIEERLEREYDAMRRAAKTAAEAEYEEERKAEAARTGSAGRLDATPASVAVGRLAGG